MDDRPEQEIAKKEYAGYGPNRAGRHGDERAAKVAESSEMSKSLNTLAIVTDELDMLINSMHDRLALVMSENFKEDTDDDDPIPSFGSERAQQIQSITQRVATNNDRLRKMLERIQA